MKQSCDKTLLGVLRLSMGWIFLWAFLDKTVGLGFATPSERAWLAGGSPTTGFLTNATSGPFEAIFKSLAGSGLVDWLFMIGLLGIGLALLLGIGIRLAMYSGAVMMLLMFLATLPVENNPVMDDHIIYVLVLVLLGAAPEAGKVFGLGKWWEKLSFVKKYPILK